MASLEWLRTDFSDYGLKEDVSCTRFIDVFERVRPNSFSRAGLVALFDYLEDLAQDLGHDIEFEPITLCCEYSEYENIEEYKTDKGIDDTLTLDDIQDEQGTVILVGDEGDGAFIVSQ